MLVGLAFVTDGESYTAVLQELLGTKGNVLLSLCVC